MPNENPAVDDVIVRRKLLAVGICDRQRFSYTSCAVINKQGKQEKSFQLCN